ncbi:16S rRNA (guanine(966)-N(2))-methyltransferase RsmD [Thalassotalea castellviae]|uniref:Ribosomal RNA small subunit methyltransferase D n=1 Tax=Thalassotalea castellviae TaxID=3075612 RepID=A0ABU3A2H9_9GAMM|nr:16S rRNA (guanine(966)-N(2))-methyltransferase RsmD [Thalassotalea sp. W431]MDT0604391.1 16S rRNA (guanine(966)-N(2))-methyltransferase RsmD [Thalassotalea sp. W431]
MRKTRNHASKGSQKAKATGNIRIIAGKHRGRKLPVLMSEGLRPTTDRVKETVFNWLMPYIQQSHCLDCFAGAGSLGFEALSRGAKQVTLIELDKNAAKQLQQNKALLNADNIDIHQTNVLNYLAAKPRGKFDIIFIDPPFRKGLAEQVINRLNDHWLAKDALIYIEMESENNQVLIPDHWTLLKEKTAGQVSYRLYRNDEE